jgi:hypothetical protein
LRQYSSINSAIASFKHYTLGRRFPEVGSDVLLTARPDGGNRTYAIVIARGIEKKAACEIRRFAKTCGISGDAFIYRLGRGPEGCNEPDLF